MTAYGDLELLAMEVAGGVATVTIDNPPMSLLTAELMREHNALHRVIDSDDDVRVIVFASADPDDFIAHGEAADITALDDHGHSDAARAAPISPG